MIGDLPPAGICGSGPVDVPAESGGEWLGRLRWLLDPKRVGAVEGGP
jgi:hypothetical protein